MVNGLSPVRNRWPMKFLELQKWLISSIRSFILCLLFLILKARKTFRGCHSLLTFVSVLAFLFALVVRVSNTFWQLGYPEISQYAITVLIGPSESTSRIWMVSSSSLPSCMAQYKSRGCSLPTTTLFHLPHHYTPTLWYSNRFLSPFYKLV